jgi:CHAT domain-containing protein
MRNNLMVPARTTVRAKGVWAKTKETGPLIGTMLTTLFSGGGIASYVQYTLDQSRKKVELLESNVGSDIKLAEEKNKAEIKLAEEKNKAETKLSEEKSKAEIKHAEEKNRAAIKLSEEKNKAEIKLSEEKNRAAIKLVVELSEEKNRAIVKVFEQQIAAEVAKTEIRTAEKFLMLGFVEEYSRYHKKVIPEKNEVPF